MKRGFTLIELLVVCSIIAIMTAIILANTHDLGINARVKSSQGLIIDTLKETRSKSVAVKQFNASVFPSYGVNFNTASPQQLTVFADCVANNHGLIDPNDRQVDSGDTFDYAHNDCGIGGNLVQTVKLDPNTKIKAIRATYPVSGVLQTSNETKVDVLFLRPEPTIWITTSSGGLLPTGKIEIDISDLKNKLIRTVVLYSSGEFTAK